MVIYVVVVIDLVIYVMVYFVKVIVCLFFGLSLVLVC